MKQEAIGHWHGRAYSFLNTCWRLATSLALTPLAVSLSGVSMVSEEERHRGLFKVSLATCNSDAAPHASWLLVLFPQPHLCLGRVRDFLG